MTCGYALSDAEPHKPGVLHLKVKSPLHKVHFEIPLVDCPAARCIEREDSICWTATHVFWSNRTRTVRDVKIVRCGPFVHGIVSAEDETRPAWDTGAEQEEDDREDSGNGGAGI